jgi:rubredoxin
LTQFGLAAEVREGHAVNDMTEREQIDHVLVCPECAAEAPPGAVGWHAVLTVGDEDAEDVEEVAVYCPECAAREFGGP